MSCLCHVVDYTVCLSVPERMLIVEYSHIVLYQQYDMRNCEYHIHISYHLHIDVFLLELLRLFMIE